MKFYKGLGLWGPGFSEQCHLGLRWLNNPRSHGRATRELDLTGQLASIFCTPILDVYIVLQRRTRLLVQADSKPTPPASAPNEVRGPRITLSRAEAFIDFFWYSDTQ